jgi:predicted porin
MNKKLLAVAVAGAFIAPAAFADSSSVTIYGNVGMSIDRVDGGSGTTNTAEGRTRVSSNNSYLGFKGSEDLGNGLSAIWQLESAYAFDNQTRNDTTNTDSVGAIGSRNTFGGLSSKTLGTLTLGNQESPMKTSIAKLDQFGNTIADYRGLMGPNTRIENSILYASPSFSGFDVKVGYGARNEAGNDTSTSVKNPSYWSSSVSYNNGPIFGAIAYENEKIVTSAVAFAAAAGTSTGTTQVNAADTKQRTVRLGFGYDFGAGKVGLGYNTTKLNNNLTGASTKVNGWLLSGSFNVSKAVVLKAQFQHDSDTKGNATASEGAKQWTIGADYILSKRTKVYALYTVLNNDTNSSRALAKNGTVLGSNTGIATVSAAAAGQDPKALSIGMVHSF